MNFNQSRSIQILFVIFIMLLIYLIYLYHVLKNNYNIDLNSSNYIKKDYIEIFSENKEKYRDNCMKLFKKIRHPDPKKIFKPPLREPPVELLKDFEMNGDTPIKKFWYINEIYSDSDSNKKSEIKSVIEDSLLNEILRKIRNNEDFNDYHDFAMRDFFNEFSPVLKNKSIAVFGTQLIWIEAVAYDVGCSEIITLEYTRKTYSDQQTRLKWFHILDYFDKAIINKEIENFDNAASFSSFGKKNSIRVLGPNRI